MKDTVNMPALALLFVAVVSFVAGLAAFGTSHGDVGIWLAVISAVLFMVCGLWFALEHSRVRRNERRWNADHRDDMSDRAAGG